MICKMARMKSCKKLVSFLLTVAVMGACCSCAELMTEKTDPSNSAVAEVPRTKPVSEDTTTSAKKAELSSKTESREQTKESGSEDPSGSSDTDHENKLYAYSVEITWKGSKANGAALTPEFELQGNGNAYQGNVDILEMDADEKGGKVSLGLPECDGMTYILCVNSIDLDTASTCPFQDATAKIYDSDGNLLASIGMPNWDYTRASTGFWYYRMCAFSEDGVLLMSELAS